MNIVDIANRSGVKYQTQSSPLQFVSLEKSFANSYDVIVYLAWGTKPLLSIRNPLLDLSDSLISGLTLLENISHLDKKPLFMFLSSGGSVYGEKSYPCSEESSTDPVSPYGIAKLTFEKYLKFYSERYGLRSVIVRPSNVYGPWRAVRDQGVIQNFIVSALKSRQITIWGDGQVVRDYLYIKDFTRLISKIIAYTQNSPNLPRYYIVNAGTGIGTSVIDVANLVKSVFGDPKVSIKFQPNELTEPPYNVLLNHRASRMFGWDPIYKIKFGISETLNFLKNIENVDKL